MTAIRKTWPPGWRRTARIKTRPRGQGSIEDWVLKGHRLARSVAYDDLGDQNPAAIDAAYERKADPVIELQLEKPECVWLTCLR